MNCPSKDTEPSNIGNPPLHLQKNLDTNRSSNPLQRFNNLDQEHWADGLGQFKELNETTTSINNNKRKSFSKSRSASSNSIKQNALFNNNNDIPPSTSSSTKLSNIIIPGPKKSIDENNNNNTHMRSASSTSIPTSRKNGELTPLRNSPENPTSFGGVNSLRDSIDSIANTTSHNRNSSLGQEYDYEDDYDFGNNRSNPSSFISSVMSRFRRNGFAPLNNNNINNNYNSNNNNNNNGRNSSSSSNSTIEKISSQCHRFYQILVKYIKFVGPGIMVSVAYMDPGNYSTAVSAGAMYQYKLLFIVLVSNLFAVFLQSLCVKLGCVTGMDLAQNCRQHLPRWLNITIYIMAEVAIIATDLAEVVGTAISLNILFKIPLSVGVILTVIDVLLVLMAYRPNGSMKIVRYFEYLVSALVFVVVVCFAIELGNIDVGDPADVWRGFMPSSELLETQGLYLSCGILGATVMPHSLYLGSGLVQPRLKDYDRKHKYFVDNTGNEESDEIAELKYKPSIHAIKYAMRYSVAELIISLFTVAIFVNSAILIVAGATLADTPDAVDADLFSIYEMLKKFLSPAAGTVFALALLFSGQSAGIVCTLAGQMVSEGFLHWSFKPWIRRIITRGLAVAPCLVVTLFVGRKGLADILTASQVVLSLLLPFVSAPLLYFTAKKSIMSVALTPANVTEQPLRTQGNDSSSAGAPVPFTRINNEDDSNINSHSFGTSLSPTQTLTDARGYREDSDSAHLLANDSDDDEEDIVVADDNTHRRPSVSDSIASSIVVPEYQDMSNSNLTNIVACIIFFLISALNMFLIISAAMGADIHL